MSEIVMYGADWCGDCRRAKRVLDELGLPVRYLDVEHEPSLVEEARKIGRSNRIPVIVLTDGTVLVEPTDPELIEAVAPVLAAEG